MMSATYTSRLRYITARTPLEAVEGAAAASPASIVDNVSDRAVTVLRDSEGKPTGVAGVNGLVPWRSFFANLPTPQPTNPMAFSEAPSSLQTVFSDASPIWVEFPTHYQRMDTNFMSRTSQPRALRTTGVRVVADDQLRQPAAVVPMWSRLLSAVREIDLSLFDVATRDFIGVVHAVLPAGREVVVDPSTSSGTHEASLGSAGRHVSADPSGAGFWIDTVGALLFYPLSGDNTLQPVEEHPASAFALPDGAVPVATTALYDAETLATAWRWCNADLVREEAVVTYRRKSSGALEDVQTVMLGASQAACTPVSTGGGPIELVALRDAVAFKRPYAVVLGVETLVRTSFVPLSAGLGSHVIAAGLAHTDVMRQVLAGARGACVRQSVALGASLLQWRLYPEGSCDSADGDSSFDSLSAGSAPVALDVNIGSAPHVFETSGSPQDRSLITGRATRSLLAHTSDGTTSALNVFTTEPSIAFARAVDLDDRAPLAIAPVLGGEGALVWTDDGLVLVR